MSASGQITKNQIPISSIHTNTELTLVQITEDKLRLVLISHLNAIESKKRWQVPLGILLALIPVLLTSEFKDIAQIEKATWKAFFMFLSLASGVWFLMTIRSAFVSTTLDELIEKLKNISK